MQKLFVILYGLAQRDNGYLSLANGFGSPGTMSVPQLRSSNINDSNGVQFKVGVPVQAAHYLVETLLSEEAVTATIGSVYEGRSHKRARPDEFPEGPHQAARRGARNHKCGPRLPAACLL